MNTDAIEQLLDVIRDLAPLLEQLRDTAADANAVDLDALIAAAAVQLIYLRTRIDAVNLATARARHSQRVE